MCRFILYHGRPLAISSLVTEPENSLIHQSFQAGEREEPLNGDGFGVAWYPTPPVRPPGLFRAVTPAWNNANLQSLARAVESTCILAHVRAATRGRAANEANCHPFVAGHWAFMHNGDLGGFHRLRRHLLAQLSEAAFSTIEGQTDSEHLFALFLDEVGGTAAETDAAGIASALKRAMARALALSVQHGDGAPSYLNLAVTDGRAAVVTRFTTDDRYDGESLYWNTGRRYVCEGGLCRMVEPDREGASVLISSERLSEDPGWEPVRAGHMVLVHADRTAHTQRIDLPSHDG